MDSADQAFDIEGRIDNISAGGLYIRMHRCLELGTMVSATVRFSSGAAKGARPLWLSVHGEVKRAVPQPGGGCGVAIEFVNHVFL